MTWLKKYRILMVFALVLGFGMLWSGDDVFAACREVTCAASCVAGEIEVTNACKTEKGCTQKACIPQSFVSSCPNFNTQCAVSCSGTDDDDAACANVACPTGTKYCKASGNTDPCASGGAGTCETPTSGVSCPDGRAYLGLSQTCTDLGTPVKICCKTSTGGGGGETGGTTAVKCDPAKFKEYAGVCFPLNTGLSETSVAKIVINLMTWLLYLFGFLAIISFVVSGIQYLAAAGNMNMIETAKRNMMYSIVGVIIALSGLVIILAIDALLKGTAWGG